MTEGVEPHRLGAARQAASSRPGIGSRASARNVKGRIVIDRSCHIASGRVDGCLDSLRMEWFAGLVVAVVAVLLIGVRHVGARRVAAGDQRAVWLVFAPTIFFAFVFLFAGLLVTVRSGPIGPFMVGLGVVSLVLLIRMARATAKAPTGPDGVDIDIGERAVDRLHRLGSAARPTPDRRRAGDRGDHRPSRADRVPASAVEPVEHVRPQRVAGVEPRVVEVVGRVVGHADPLHHAPRWARWRRSSTTGSRPGRRRRSAWSRTATAPSVA